MDATPVTLALDQLQVPYRFFKHPGQVHSVEQAALERGMSIDQVVRSIVFRTGPDDYVMVLVTGVRQISWPLLRKYLNAAILLKTFDLLSALGQVEIVQFSGEK